MKMTNDFFRNVEQRKTQFPVKSEWQKKLWIDSETVEVFNAPQEKVFFDGK